MKYNTSAKFINGERVVYFGTLARKLRHQMFVRQHSCTVMSVYRDIKQGMGENSPAKATFYGAFYGERSLPAEAALFLIDERGWKLDWKDFIACAEPKKGLPGMRELKR